MGRADAVLLRVNTDSLTFALRFASSQDADGFQQDLENLRLPCTSLGCHPRTETLIPDLRDPVTQEHLIQLLCSSEFEDFVGNLGCFLDQMRDKF